MLVIFRFLLEVILLTLFYKLYKLFRIARAKLLHRVTFFGLHNFSIFFFFGLGRDALPRERPSEQVEHDIA